MEGKAVYRSRIALAAIKAPVRICAEGDQRWSSLPRQLVHRFRADGINNENERAAAPFDPKWGWRFRPELVMFTLEL